MDECDLQCPSLTTEHHSQRNIAAARYQRIDQVNRRQSMAHHHFWVKQAPLPWRAQRVRCA